jgi:hypothetical protein
MPLVILGILIIVGTILILIFRSKSIKNDARKIDEQAKRRNES